MDGIRRRQGSTYFSKGSMAITKDFRVRTLFRATIVGLLVPRGCRLSPLPDRKVFTA